MRRLALLLGCVVALAGCSPSEARIKREIEEASTCDAAEDCVLVGSTCPFGCYIYVHQAEAERIKALVDGYDSQCVYGCAQSLGVECRDHRCRAITEKPPMDALSNE